MNMHVEAARRELADLEQKAEMLRLFIASWEAVAPLLGNAGYPDSSSEKNLGETVDESAIRSSQDGNAQSRTVIVPTKRTRVTDNPKPSVLVPAAIEILRKQGRPMSRRELHAALAERGLEVRGADPVKALGTILWRASDDLIQLDGYGYWPKEDQYRPANYAGSLLQGLMGDTST